LYFPSLMRVKTGILALTGSETTFRYCVIYRGRPKIY
jgi:hypothetical protein